MEVDPLYFAKTSRKSVLTRNSREVKRFIESFREDLAKEDPYCDYVDDLLVSHLHRA